MEIKTKKCTKCNKILPLYEYGKDITKSSGISSSCKQCKDNETKRRRLKIKEKIKEIPSEKICSSCGKNKSSDNFSKLITSKDGLYIYCKECVKQNKKKEKYPVLIDDTIKKICRMCNVEKPLSEYKINRKSSDNFSHICIICKPNKPRDKEKQKASEQKYILNNPEKIKEKNRRQSQNINRRIRNSLNKRIIEALLKTKNSKSKNLFEYIGCNIYFFKKWIEYQFVDNMNWNNYGKWHFDHVKPCCSYNLSNQEEVKECFNWKNIQPLWANENIKKNNKIDDNLIKLQHEKANNYENIINDNNK